MFKLLELEATCMFFGVNAEGANAATEPTEKAATERVNFILFIKVIREIRTTGVAANLWTGIVCLLLVSQKTRKKDDNDKRRAG
jgi:hypothetical protein